MNAIKSIETKNEVNWGDQEDDVAVPQATKRPFVQLAFGRFAGDVFVRESPFIMCREILGLCTMAAQLDCALSYGSFYLPPEWVQRGTAMITCAEREETLAGGAPLYAQQALVLSKAMLILNLWENAANIPNTEVCNEYAFGSLESRSLGLIIKIPPRWTESPMGISYYVLLLRMAVYAAEDAHLSMAVAAGSVPEAKDALLLLRQGGVGNPNKFMYNVLPEVNKDTPITSDITLKYDEDDGGWAHRTPCLQVANNSSKMYFDSYISTCGINSQLAFTQGGGYPQRLTQKRLKAAMAAERARLPHVVAVYGTLRKGQGNHRLLLTDNAELVWEGYDNIPFRMFGQGNPFPYLVKNDYTTDIFVEIYAMDGATFAALDNLEGYPSFYDRTEEFIGGVTCWVYHVNAEDAHGGVIEGGDWVKRQ